MDTYYRTNEVAELLRLSKTTLFRMAKRGDLPSPIRLSQSSIRWSKQGIDNLLAERIMYANTTNTTRTFLKPTPRE